MGMLFNTPTTLQAIAMVNKAFEPKKFNSLQNAFASGTLWATNLENAFVNLSTATAGGGGNIYQVVTMHPLYLDFDTTSPPGTDASNRWQKWLGFLDAQGNGTISWSAVIAREIARAVKDAKCNGIEYFAVPGLQIEVAIAYFVVGQAPVSAPPATKYTTIITVTTNTVDQLHAVYERRHRR